jgi:hypothetical protein
MRALINLHLTAFDLATMEAESNPDVDFNTAYVKYINVLRARQFKDLYIGNLWSVDDVREHEDSISDADAMMVLDKILNSEGVIGHIQDAIRWYVEDMVYQQRKEESI